MLERLVCKSLIYAVDADLQNADRVLARLDSRLNAGIIALEGGRAAPSVSIEPEVIRAWARAHGHTVSSRGRIPAEIKQAYVAAHPPA